MKNIFYLVLLSILFAGCKKNGDDKNNTGYYVKFKLNGILVTNTGYNQMWLKPELANPNQIIFQLTSTSGDFKNTLGITVQKDGSVHEGAYESSNNGYYLIVDYFKNQGSAEERDYTVEDSPGMASSTFTVNLTSITDSYIKGTFEGNYLYDYSHNETIEITNGEFYVRRLK